MKSLVITVEASRDLSAISDYFLEQNVDAGDRFVEGFGKKCQHLAQFPYWRSYSQLAPGLRGVPLMGYIIFYQIVEDEDKIEILRIISGYRNLNNIFTRRLNGRSAIALSLPVCTNFISESDRLKHTSIFSQGGFC